MSYTTIDKKAPVIKMENINEAWDRVIKADVKYRFVIDLRSFE